MSNNLRFWAQGAHVPEEARKDFRREGGFSGTDINTMWRVRTLTEMFGPIGIGWRFSTVKRWTETYETGEMKAYAEIALSYRDPETGEWSEPIYGVGGNSAILERRSGRVANDECYKMAETDAFGRACMWLGIGSDVYWSTDRTKYVLNDDGTVDAHVPTKEELRAENRARLAEMAKAEEEARKASKAQKEADAKGAEVAAEEQIGEDKVGEKMAEHCGIDLDKAKLALIRFHSGHIAEDPNPILAKHIEDNGGMFMANWSNSTIIACYQEMVLKKYIEDTATVKEGSA